MFHTSFGVNSVGLSNIFGQVGVDKLNNIESDRGSEDSGEDDFSLGNFERVVSVENGYEGSCGHLFV